MSTGTYLRTSEFSDRTEYYYKAAGQIGRLRRAPILQTGSNALKIGYACDYRLQSSGAPGSDGGGGDLYIIILLLLFPL